MKTIKDIEEEINQLTENEDYRQELWVYYLEGHKPDSMARHLQILKNAYIEGECIDRKANELVNCEISEELLEAIGKLNPFNKSVALMLLLGYTIQEISLIKNISFPRAKQVVTTILSRKDFKKFRS